MDIIEEELTRLKVRLDELMVRIVPDFEDRTQTLYGQIIQLPRDAPHRKRLEQEFARQSKELSLRSDEVIRIRQEIANLEQEKLIRR